MPIPNYYHEDILDPTSLLDWVADAASSAGGRKVMFVVGAPLTEPERGSDLGVANVTHMIDLALRKIESRRPAIAAELRRRRDDELLDGEMYQQTMSRLGEVFDEDTVNEVVRMGVLRAIAPGERTQDDAQSRVRDVEFLRVVEQQHRSWTLRAGVDALGRLLAAGLAGVAPIVLTSNFDPLIEVAIRKHGGVPQTVRFDRDGALDNLDLHSTPVKVVHFHGWWLEGATLHTGPMLTSTRPALASAMEQLLCSFAVVPVAYGGWADVFTSSLSESCARDRVIDVRWGLYPRNKAKARGECGYLVNRYPPNRVRFYRGVDCHQFFPDLVERLLPASAPSSSEVNTFVASPQPLPMSQLSDAIDWEAVRILRRAVEDRTPGSSGPGDDRSFLEKRLGVLVRDAEQRLALTREAIILVGTVQAIRSLLARPVVDIQVRRDSERPDPAVRWDDREVVEENLVRARLRLLERFVATMRDRLDDGRVDGPVSGAMTGNPRYIAFREAAVNLLVHQRYEPGSAKGLIELGQHGWQFDNAGCPAGSKAELVSPTPLPYRNPLLNQAFRVAGWTEDGKTGLRAMSAAWMRLGLAPPKVILDGATDRFKVEFSFKERFTVQAAAWIVQLGMSPDDVQRDFLGLLAGGYIKEAAEFQLAMALPRHDFNAVLGWAVMQRIIDRESLERGTILPTASFAGRILAVFEGPTTRPSSIAKGEMLSLDDTSLRILSLFAEGIMTVPRLLEATGLSRPTIATRLRRLLDRGLLRVDRTSNTYIWTMTELGEATAKAIAR